MPELLAEIGWTGGEAITDGRMFLHYFRTTADGRVLMGSGSGPIGFGGRVDDRFTHDARDARRGPSAGLRALLPGLGRRADRARLGRPDRRLRRPPARSSARSPGTRVHYGVGYTGNGVGPSWLGGQILASLVLGADDEWTRLPLVARRVPRAPAGADRLPRRRARPRRRCSSVEDGGGRPAAVRAPGALRRVAAAASRPARRHALGVEADLGLLHADEVRNEPRGHARRCSVVREPVAGSGAGAGCARLGHVDVVQVLLAEAFELLVDRRRGRRTAAASALETASVISTYSATGTEFFSIRCTRITSDAGERRPVRAVGSSTTSPSWATTLTFSRPVWWHASHRQSVSAPSAAARCGTPRCIACVSAASERVELLGLGLGQRRGTRRRPRARRARGRAPRR